MSGLELAPGRWRCAPAGCRGFIGPVPQPLFMRFVASTNADRLIHVSQPVNRIFLGGGWGAGETSNPKFQAPEKLQLVNSKHPDFQPRIDAKGIAAPGVLWLRFVGRVPPRGGGLRDDRRPALRDGLHDITVSPSKELGRIWLEFLRELRQLTQSGRTRSASHSDPLPSAKPAGRQKIAHAIHRWDFRCRMRFESRTDDRPLSPTTARRADLSRRSLPAEVEAGRGAALESGENVRHVRSVRHV
jgi:hypothetical protein